MTGIIGACSCNNRHSARCTLKTGGDRVNIIEVNEESMWMAESTCPTQDCVRTGKATHPGQSIVCLPEQVIVKLVGMKTESDPDLIIG